MENNTNFNCYRIYKKLYYIKNSLLKLLLKNSLIFYLDKCAKLKAGHYKGAKESNLGKGNAKKINLA